MKRWLELRTAYQVAKHGKVTEAAEALGVHRATVNRHIDALEADLGVRLFLRHGQGYALTEIGEDFLLVAQRAEEMFTDFFGRTELAEGGLTGEVILTAPLAISGVFATPILRFQTEHPEIRVKLIAEDGLAKLEYGEAHVALRGGSKPEEPDYVVQRFTGVRLELYAHTSYVARMGMPQSPSDFSAHRFVDNPGYFMPAAIRAWIAAHIPQERITIVTSRPEATRGAIMAGAAIGFMPEYEAKACSDLVALQPPHEDWAVPMWLVTHVDLHRTEKVQAILRCIKDTYPQRMTKHS